MIQFLLNHSLITLDRPQADTTLLDYLRLQAGLTGSKEGCASGDCGACTVVVASPDSEGETLEYKSVNSCICLLGSLHGKQVITVEGLCDREGGLHPLQEALVEWHASQCGFCTPGFVMSLFAMSRRQKKFSRSDIIEGIDGNLCRCTGYRPIIDAAQSVLNQVPDDDNDSDNDLHHDKEILKRLNAIAASSSRSSRHFLIPQSVAELSQFIEQYPQAKLLAGGTDLALSVTQGLQHLEKIIYLGKVRELKRLTQDKNSLRIGAAVTYEGCVKALSDEYPVLQKHLSRIGSLQIRNVATLGGNIANASPVADMPPVLMALDTQLLLQKGEQQRQVAVDDFYTGYKQSIMQTGEFIREIQIPKARKDHFLFVYKISKRYADDISAVCAAFYIHFQENTIISARIAFGGMAATVTRAGQCEQALTGQNLDNSNLLEKAKRVLLNDFDPLDDVRASREYRLRVAQNCLQRVFLELAEVENK